MLSKIRQDSDLNAFFSRQLEVIKAQTYDVKYPQLRARDFIPVSGEGAAGARNVTYRQYDRSGRAKIIGPNSKDSPRVDLQATEFTRPARSLSASYGFDFEEVESAATAGLNLDARKAAAARRVIEELLDEVACFGSPDDGIVDGMLNNANVPVTTLGAPDDFQTLVGGGNNARIVEIFSEAYQRIVGNSLNIEMPDTVLLPTAEHALLATTPFGDNSDKTILDFILSNFPGISAVEPWYRLDAAGAGSTTRMVMYNRSPDVLTQDILKEFEQRPPQEQGLETVIYTLAKTAGTAIYYPLAMDFTDGV